VTQREYDLENALKWLRQVALLHYMGGAFEPEHMRDIANVAAKVIGGKALPDYDLAMARSREKADALYDRVFRPRLDPDEDVKEDEEDGP
jgi:hypothetical protein